MNIIIYFLIFFIFKIFLVRLNKAPSVRIGPLGLCEISYYKIYECWYKNGTFRKDREGFNLSWKNSTLSKDFYSILVGTFKRKEVQFRLLFPNCWPGCSLVEMGVEGKQDCTKILKSNKLGFYGINVAKTEKTLCLLCSW